MSKGILDIAKYFKRDNALVTSGAFSVAAFVKLDNIGATHSVFGFYDAGSDDDWFRLAIKSDNTVAAQMKKAAALEEISSLGTLSADVWHFVGAKIAANGTMGVWLDGERQDSVAGKPWAINLDNTAIGVRLTDTITEPLDGCIGPIAAWESEVTAAAIRWMRDHRRDPRYYGSDPCDHYWRMLRWETGPVMPDEVTASGHLDWVGDIPYPDDGPEPELSLVARGWRVGSRSNYIGGYGCARYRRFFTGQRDRSASPLRR